MKLGSSIRFRLLPKMTREITSPWTWISKFFVAACNAYRVAIVYLLNGNQHAFAGECHDLGKNLVYLFVHDILQGIDAAFSEGRIEYLPSLFVDDRIHQHADCVGNTKCIGHRILCKATVLLVYSMMN
jgi:hypothetical protein